ncbi:hypothetical protein DSOL_2690 [Desulfosporosinus metallidurans]|uniref:Uncharacterized protein n=1 Tax=Desulfosporosinus metallidurans TaxID=1888891 RepID=A0A1Q8QVI2_9FIRM|nr:hypothetical protein DSOL_2690 [Desulfosporosinus metallidurans]
MKNYLQKKEKLPTPYISSRLKPPVQKGVAYFRRLGKRKR